MCGIAGVITKTDNFSIQYYPRIFKETLSHRGPDESGEYIQQNWSFAHLRLSIVDVQGGQQPIRNDDGSVGIIYNGEVYNFEELKKTLIQSGYTFNTNSDTEVILRAYEAYGSESFNKLNGMFAFCLWDHNKDEVYLVRDHFGIKPLYVYEDAHQIVFSSELRGILVLPNLDLTLDPLGFQDYLTFRYIQAPYTFFKNIKRVEAGTYWKIRSSRHITRHRYYDTTYSQPFPAPSLPEVKDVLQEKLQQAVQSQLMGEVPIGVLLSGGLDSSAIAYYIHTLGANLTTFNIGFSEVNEFQYSREVAQSFGLKHVEILVTPQDFTENFATINAALDEPIADPACLPLYCLGEELKKYVTVVLSGEAGDELFGGYNQYLHTLRADISYHHRFKAFLEHSFYFLDGVNLLNDNSVPPLQYRYKKYFEELPLLNGMLAYDMNTWMPENLMMKADKVLMAHSLEGRFPFLDRDLFDYVAALPLDYKISSEGTTKWLLKEIMAPHLPKTIIKRPKMGFTVPVESMLEQLKPTVLATFVALQSSTVGDVLNTALMRQLVEDYYLKKAPVSALQVWTWFTMAYWFVNSFTKLTASSALYEDASTMISHEETAQTYQKRIYSDVSPEQKAEIRKDLSHKYLLGHGIEIGALHAPLIVSDEVHVQYVDLLTREQNIQRYPEIDAEAMVEVDIVDDAEYLTAFQDDSLDFIIANHMLEHCENPLGTLRNHIAKVKKGGNLYYAVPNKDFTFDKERPLTTFDHLVNDDQQGSEISKLEHYREFARFVDQLTNNEDIENHVTKLMAMDNRIHFHVWDAQSLEQFFLQAQAYLEGSFEIIEFVQSGDEIIVILAKALFPAHFKKRSELSCKFVRGNGIEIGAWNSPLYVSEEAQVKYVDIVSKEEHLRRDPNFKGPDIEIIDDGETLTTVENESLDFIIANHVLEHCQNPLGTLQNHLLKLRTNGILFYAVPNKRFTFDSDRPLTSLEHLLADAQDNGAASKYEHYREWATYVDKLSTEAEIEAKATELEQKDLRIHFHVWDETSLKTFFLQAKNYLDYSFQILDFVQDGIEVIVIIQKTPVIQNATRQPLH